MIAWKKNPATCANERRWWWRRVQLALQERDTDNAEVALTWLATRGALQLMLDSGEVVETGEYMERGRGSAQIAIT
ncbi:hypothetical protein QYF36_014416 [Acer negundo]|nr:hypothetical protein QYF36_014416 [Acer negundo]